MKNVFMRIAPLAVAASVGCGSSAEACNESRVRAHDAWVQLATDIEAAAARADQAAADRAAADAWLEGTSGLAGVASGSFIGAPAPAPNRYGIEGPPRRTTPTDFLNEMDAIPPVLAGEAATEMRRELQAAAAVERALANDADARATWTRDGAPHIRQAAAARQRLVDLAAEIPTAPSAATHRVAAQDARRVAELARGGAIPMRDAAQPQLERLRTWGLPSYDEAASATSDTWESCQGVDP